MKMTRRDFLKLCGVSAAAVGLSATDLTRLEEVLANPNGPTVIWLQGTACTGCSMSFLNRISSVGPYTAADVLIDSINLVYHPNLMSLAGDSAVAQIEKAYKAEKASPNAAGYILAIEGGVPTNFGGNTCWAWSYNGEDVTFQQAVLNLSPHADAILCIGTCASYGGIAAVPPNPTGVQGVKALTGKTTINIVGCPPHPDWVVWAVVQLLLGKTVTLDSFGRPKVLFNGKTVHDLCPRRGTEPAKTFGIDGRCLKELGCRGPQTIANCPQVFWNGGVNWCVDTNAPCIGCANPKFPDLTAFYKF